MQCSKYSIWDKGLIAYTCLIESEIEDLTLSAYALLNLLNSLGKRNKMQAVSSILSLFCNEFNKFNNTVARMLDSIYFKDSIYYIALKLLIIFLEFTPSIFCLILRNILMDIITLCF